MKRTKTILLALLGLTLAFPGCGSNPLPAGQGLGVSTLPGWGGFDPTSGCQNGMIKWGGHCVYPGTPQNQCQQIGGYGIGSQLDVCKKIYSSGFFTLPYIPRLTPSQPYGMNTGIYVYPGDKVTYSGSGSWGSIKEKTYQGLIFTWGSFSYNCSEISISGSKSGNFVYNENEKAGMFGATPTETFYMGSSSNFVINEEGQFYMGINRPEGSACGTLYINNFSLTRCIQSDGSISQCPI